MDIARDRSRSRSSSSTVDYNAPGLAARYAILQRDFNKLQDLVFAQRDLILLHEKDLAKLRLQMAMLESSR